MEDLTRIWNSTRLKKGKTVIPAGSFGTVQTRLSNDDLMVIFDCDPGRAYRVSITNFHYCRTAAAVNYTLEIG